MVKQELVPVVKANPGGCSELVQIEELPGFWWFVGVMLPIP